MKTSFLIAAALSILLASLIITIAIDHNPMQTYCQHQPDGDCLPNYTNIAQLWLSWFLPCFIILFALCYLIKKVIQKIKHG